MTELAEEFAKLKWFHAIDFGDFASIGRFQQGRPQNITLYGFMDMIRHVDLAGAETLDIGSVDGISSFGMKTLGARRAVATDSVDKHTFRRAREVLGLDIEYHPDTQIKDFGRIFQRGSFDVILCAGVIYHMFNPVSAFLECRKIIKEGGLLFMETPYFAGEKRACIFVNSETEMVNEIFTYSVPTEAAVRGLMKLAGFEILAVRKIQAPDRITVLGRATGLNSIPDRTRLLKRIHEIDTCDFEFRFGKYVPAPVASSVTYTGPRDDLVIDHKSYQPVFPHHPQVDKPAVGHTAWHSSVGNH